MSEKIHVETPSEGSVERTGSRPTISPRVDIIERADDFVILADMPGIDPSTLEIGLEKNVLTLEASGETSAGDSYRAFRIGREVDRERIEATYERGVLRLTLPKAAPARSLKIAVKAK